MPDDVHGTGRREAADGAGPAPGTIRMALGRQGYVGAVRLGDGGVHVAAALDVAAVRAEGARQAMAGICEEAGLVLPTTRLIGTPPLTHRAPRVAGRRLFVVGDAAGYAEPLTGQGIAWALASAEAVVEPALAGVQAWRDELASWWTAHHAAMVLPGHRRSLGVVRALGWPGLARMVVRMLQHRPGLARPVSRWLC